MGAQKGEQISLWEDFIWWDNLGRAENVTNPEVTNIHISNSGCQCIDS